MAKVLIIEDDASNRKILEMSLKQFQVEVKTAGSGADALDLVGTFEPNLIFLDIMMPKMSGTEFLKIIRENPRLQGVKVIVVSANISEETRMNVLELGANEFLVKPFRVQEIAKMAGKYLS